MIRRCLGTVLFGFLASSGYGSIQQYADSSAPYGADASNVTRDTDTGIEWLDWDASSGVSYADVLANSGSGQTYEGWTHATLGQVEEFFTNLGLPVDGWPSYSTVMDGGTSANYAQSFLGVTELSGGGTSPRVYAMTLDMTPAYDPGKRYAAVITENRNSIGPAGTQGVSSDTGGFSYFDEQVGDAIYGHALIRMSQSQVPEPSPFALAALGLVGAGVQRRRRSRAA